MERQAAFYRGYLIDDRSLEPADGGSGGNCRSLVYRLPSRLHRRDGERQRLNAQRKGPISPTNLRGLTRGQAQPSFRRAQSNRDFPEPPPGRQFSRLRRTTAAFDRSTRKTSMSCIYYLMLIFNKPA
jgi:hypothetical protein